MAQFNFDDNRYEYHIIEIDSKFGVQCTFYNERNPTMPPPVTNRVERKQMQYLFQYTNGRDGSFWHSMLESTPQYVPVLWDTKEDLLKYIKGLIPKIVGKIEKPS